MLFRAVVNTEALITPAESSELSLSTEMPSVEDSCPAQGHNPSLGAWPPSLELEYP